MSNKPTNFWDFAKDNPEIVYAISLLLIIGITISVLAIAGVFNHP